MVKKILFLYLLGSASIGFSQSYLGVHFNPGIAGAFVKATAPYANKTQAEFNDSIHQDQNTIFSPSFGIHYEQRLKRFDEIYIALRYQVYGWGRKKTDLLFPDSIHGDIGKIQAIQPAGDVQFSFKFHNISIPFYFLKTLKYTKMPTGMNVGFYGGGALNVLVSQKSTAKTIGFTAYNKREFDLPSETFKMLPVTISLEAGIRVRQELGDNYFFNFMPGASFIPFRSKNSKETQYQYRLQAGLGISKSF